MTTQIRGNTFPVKEQLRALGGRWNAGEKCWEVPDDKAEEARALVAPYPLYNSPPPQDLGTAGPEELAARFGRVAAPGATVRSFTGYGKTPGPDGQVETVKGRRYVRVGHGAPRYYSRDMLEDFDMFSEAPGYQYQWDGVEVEPTAEERAADEEKAAAKAAADAARAAAADAEKARVGAAAAAFAAAVEGLVEVSVSPAGLTDAAERIEITRDVVARKVILPDGRAGWRKSINAYDDHRTYYYLPADAATAACLAAAESYGITPESAADWLGKYGGCHGAEVYRAVAEADPATHARLREAAAAKQAADRARAAADERRSLEIAARHAVEKIGALKGLVVSWELRPGVGLDAYCAARAANRHGGARLEGAVVVLRLADAAFQKPSPRSRKPAPADSAPAELVLHNFCTARVVVERVTDG